MPIVFSNGIQIKERQTKIYVKTIDPEAICYKKFTFNII